MTPASQPAAITALGLGALPGRRDPRPGRGHLAPEGRLGRSPGFPVRGRAHRTAAETANGTAAETELISKSTGSRVSPFAALSRAEYAAGYAAAACGRGPASRPLRCGQSLCNSFTLCPSGCRTMQTVQDPAQPTEFVLQLKCCRILSTGSCRPRSIPRRRPRRRRHGMPQTRRGSAGDTGNTHPGPGACRDSATETRHIDSGWQRRPRHGLGLCC